LTASKIKCEHFGPRIIMPHSKASNFVPYCFNIDPSGRLLSQYVESNFNEKVREWTKDSHSMEGHSIEVQTSNSS